MRNTRLLAILCIAFLLVFAYGCSKGAEETETAEHTHEGETATHTHEGEGEESGPQRVRTVRRCDCEGRVTRKQPGESEGRERQPSNCLQAL